jgi:uncharacterized membrane-anchored protein
MCGTNLGDLVPSLFNLEPLPTLVCLLTAFIVVVASDRMIFLNRSVAAYWVAILVVRTAATTIADAAAHSTSLGYALIAANMLALLTVLLLIHRPGEMQPTSGDAYTDIRYWLLMLTAGSLGTVIGDGLGHSIGRPQVGWPVAFAIATVLLPLALSLRRSWSWSPEIGYWTAIVVVRWWGTNAGDILAYLVTVPVSMIVTAGALVLVLTMWRTRPFEGFSSPTA